MQSTPENLRRLHFRGGLVFLLSGILFLIVGCDQVKVRLDDLIRPANSAEALKLMSEKVQSGELKDALDVGESYLSSNGEDESGLVNLEVGRLLASLGDLSRSIHFLTEAVQRSSNNLEQVLGDEQMVRVWSQREGLILSEVLKRPSTLQQAQDSSNAHGNKSTVIQAGDVSITTVDGKTEIRAGNLILKD